MTQDEPHHKLLSEDYQQRLTTLQTSAKQTAAHLARLQETLANADDMVLVSAKRLAELEAIEAMMKEARPNLPQEIKAQVNPSSINPRYGRVTRICLRLFEAYPSREWTSGQLVKEVSNTFTFKGQRPSHTVYQACKSLIRDRQIKCTFKGHGRNPTRYRRIPRT